MRFGGNKNMSVHAMRKPSAFIVAGMSLFLSATTMLANEISNEEIEAEILSETASARLKKLESTLNNAASTASDLIKSTVGLEKAKVEKIEEIDEKKANTELWESAMTTFPQPKLDGIDVTNSFVIEDIVEPVGVYRYAAFGKPDPFLPPYGTYALGKTAAFEIPIVSPLQIPLDRLRVSGLWELENGERRALILTGDGQGIIAKKGDPIGLSGKIIEINEGGVITRQYKIRADGSREFEDISLLFGEEKKSLIGERIIMEPGKDPTLVEPPKSTQKVVVPPEPAPYAQMPLSVPPDMPTMSVAPTGMGAGPTNVRGLPAAIPTTPSAVTAPAFPANATQAGMQ